tara:strand:+ start:1742 stop:2041 length:300 start_codon:yes stop_codon:yes gene_type:complete
MKITQTDISVMDFQRAFIDYGRATQFSNEGLDGLYEYLEELFNDLGEEYELDVIELCCEYTEYDSVDEYFAQYGGFTETEARENIVSHLYSGGVIVRDW